MEKFFKTQQPGDLSSKASIENNYGNSNDDDDNNDIVVKDKKKRNCHLIDMNVPTRSSVKMTEKLSLLEST